MCVLTCILKIVISIINSILMIIGIILLVVGAILLWGMNSITNSAFNLQAEIQNLLNTFQIKVDATGVLSFIQQSSSTFGVVAFVLGIILVVVSILVIIALCCCTIKRVLIAVCLFLVAITIALIVFVIVLGTSNADKEFGPIVKYLQTNIVDKYQDITSTDPQSILVNVVQISFHCCGLGNYTDFRSAPNFIRFAYDSTNKKHAIIFPLSCCNYNSDYTISQANRDSCIQTSLSTDMNIGCWSKLQPKLSYYINFAINSIGITIGVLIAMIIATCILIYLADKVDV